MEELLGLAWWARCHRRVVVVADSWELIWKARGFRMRSVFPKRDFLGYHVTEVGSFSGRIK